MLEERSGDRRRTGVLAGQRLGARSRGARIIEQWAERAFCDQHHRGVEDVLAGCPGVGPLG